MYRTFKAMLKEWFSAKMPVTMYNRILVPGANYNPKTYYPVTSWETKFSYGMDVVSIMTESGVVNYLLPLVCDGTWLQTDCAYNVIENTWYVYSYRAYLFNMYGDWLRNSFYDKINKVVERNKTCSNIL